MVSVGVTVVVPLPPLNAVLLLHADAELLQEDELLDEDELFDEEELLADDELLECPGLPDEVAVLEAVDVLLDVLELLLDAVELQLADALLDEEEFALDVQVRVTGVPLGTVMSVPVVVGVLAVSVMSGL